MRKISLIFLILLVFAPSFSGTTLEDNWFGPDKIAHLTTSFALTLWSYSFFRYQRFKNFDDSILLSVSVSISLGTIKEISDMLRGRKKKNNHFSLKDMAYNIAGIGLGLLILNLGR